MKPALQRWLRRTLTLVLLVSLAAVFTAYQNPHLAVDIANSVWACF